MTLPKLALRCFMYTLTGLSVDYDVWDYIIDDFPEQMPEEEVRDLKFLIDNTPGSNGIKYVWYIGSKLYGILGGIVCTIAALLPLIAVSLLFVLIQYLFLRQVEVVERNEKALAYINSAGRVLGSAFNCMQAVTGGLIFAHIYRIVKANTRKKANLFIILPSAAIYIFAFGDTSVGIYFMLTAVGLGAVLGLISALRPKSNKPEKKKKGGFEGGFHGM